MDTIKEKVREYAFMLGFFLNPTALRLAGLVFLKKCNNVVTNVRCYTAKRFLRKEFNNTL